MASRRYRPIGALIINPRRRRKASSRRRRSYGAGLVNPRRRRRSAPRRRRSYSGYGAVLVNPRRRRRSASRRRRSYGAVLVNPRRRRSRRRTRRNPPPAYARFLARRRAVRRPIRRARIARRRARLAFAPRPRRARRPFLRRRFARRRPWFARRRRLAMMHANPRRRRRAGRVAYVRSNPRRRRSRRGYRRNPVMLGGLQSSLRRIPLVGGVLASMVGFAPHSLFGAVAVEPITMAASFLGQYVPGMNASVFYAGTGLALAALVQRFAPVSPALREKLAVAIASAAGGVAYYKWRTGTSSDMATETAGLAGPRGFAGGGFFSGWGDSQYAVVPYAGDLSGGDYADALWGDAAYLGGDDLSGDELGAARLGRAAWGRRFKKGRRIRSQGRGRGASSNAGQEGHRWGWLIRLIGWDNFQKIAEQGQGARKQYIAQLKQQAIALAQSGDFSSGDGSESADMAGVIYGY